jgi:hypothetical protein
VLEMTSRGGKEYGESAVDDFEGNSKLVSRVEKVDDKELDRWVTSVRNAVLKLFRTTTVHTDFGIWFADTHMLAQVEDKMTEFRDVMLSINQRSRALGSKRETRGEYFSVPWPHRDLKLRLRLGQMIYDRLKRLRDAYTLKHIDAYRTAMDRCLLLDRLVEEPQASLIRDAVNATKQQRPLMIRYSGGSNVPVELLALSSKEIKFDYRPIDKALKEFEPVANLFVTELPT